MSRQDKAITERNAKTLRELVKKPDNKVCADCKRNDPRWASWNLGLFLCIRCSGIHRSMGTHISKIKSIDLDAWTPPQMENVQKWGNRLGNKYWEAHLKPGHVPQDHKMDSFIRSKYEMRRWALERPYPEDPSVLDTDAPLPAEAPPQQELVAAPPAQQSAPAVSATTAARHQLLSATYQQQPQPQRLQAPMSQPQKSLLAAQPSPASPLNDLFSLDFHSPTTLAPAGQDSTTARNSKQDIMSLFTTLAPAPQPQAQMLRSQPQPQPQIQIQSQPQSMMGMNGTGMWGVSSGWAPPQQQQLQSQVIWGDMVSAPPSTGFGGSTQQQPVVMQMQTGGMQPQMGFGGQAQPQQQQQQLFGTNDIWASSAPPTGGGSTGGQKDAFDDIWGGFK